MAMIVITGANRGIGLELATQYAANGDSVVAGCRNPGTADALNKLAVSADLRVVQLDVSDAASIAGFAAALSGKFVDVLINNAGVMGGNQSFNDMDYDAWAHAFAVNTQGPLRVTEAVALNMKEGSKVITISSQMGSMARNSAGAYAYRSTKAAVNKVVQLMALDLKPRIITCIAMHPGWVQTDMGGSGADITPSESASGIRKVIEGLALEQTGSFIKWNGEAHDW